MGDITVSVIVPIYNVEGYLSICLDSLINQTFKNLEIIIINDGSSDSSRSVAESYIQKDDRIRIIDQLNSGVSKARNVGILNAKGKYIMFVDSDDWIELDAIDELFKLVHDNNCDFIWFDDYIIDEKSNIIEITTFPFVKNTILENEMVHNIMAKFIIKGGGQYGCCNKIYRKKILLENNIQFIEDMPYAEDYYFLMELMKFVKRVMYIDKALYYYLTRSHSAVTKYYSQLTNICYKNTLQKLDYMKICNLISKENIELFRYSWYKDALRSLVNIGNSQNKKLLKMKISDIKLIKSSNHKVNLHIKESGVPISFNMQVFINKVLFGIPSIMLVFAANILYKIKQYRH